jgi:hypothetical protein
MEGTPHSTVLKTKKKQLKKLIMNEINSLKPKLNSNP